MSTEHEKSSSSSSASRRDFLKTSALAGLGTLAAQNASSAAPATGANAKVKLPSGITLGPEISLTRPRPKGQKPVHNLTTKPLEKVRVALIGCHRGATHGNDAANIEFSELVAVCDWRKNRAEALADSIGKRTKRPEVYGGTENIWEQMVDRDDIDVVYIATPWEWHAPMALRAMERGKHAFIEVPAFVSMEDGWRLVDTSERTQRHCVMIENCCYGENELFVLNMAREGVFGELNHGECAYIHDLRGLLFNLGGEGEWRRNYHKLYDGNLYPTHGLGPVAQYMGIGRGDQFSHLVSLSSPERGLTKWRDEHNPNNGAQKNEIYNCGDMNTTLIKTAQGRSIMVQHDVISPRPYSRINMLSGTGGAFMDYPARLTVDNPKKYGLKSSGSHEWMDEADMKIMRDKFTHPLWKGLQEKAKGGGHGGMDYVLNYRMLDCIRRGATPDITVYDTALWSSIVELSSRSVALGSMPVDVPDFTRGLWKNLKPLDIVKL